jgi:26S proteasome regulatory subunit N11
MEVMGLMLGEFVDDYTVSFLFSSSLRVIADKYPQISCVDVFAMPQSGTTVTVESVDHVFQTKMLDMLKQTGRWVTLLGHGIVLNERSDRKWLSGGIIRIPGLDVGCLV